MRRPTTMTTSEKAYSREPTSGLEPLTCSSRVIRQALQVLHRLTNTAYLSLVPCYALPRVASYCAPGGVRVVSTMSRIRSLTLPRLGV